MIPPCVLGQETSSGTGSGDPLVAPYQHIYIYTWWFIPLSKWVITPIISGLTLLIPFITGVITHLLSGMSHQVCIYIYMHYVFYSKLKLWDLIELPHTQNIPTDLRCQIDISLGPGWMPKNQQWNHPLCDQSYGPRSIFGI